MFGGGDNVLSLACSLIQFLLVPLTLVVLLMFKMLSNIWGKGEDIPLRHAQAVVADIVAVKLMVWLMLFYLGGRYLWPTHQPRNTRFQITTMVVLTIAALGLSLTDHYLFTHSLGDYLAKQADTWGSSRKEAYQSMLARNPAWSFLMPLAYLTINLLVGHRRDRDRFTKDLLPKT